MIGSISGFLIQVDGIYELNLSHVCGWAHAVRAHAEQMGLKRWAKNLPPIWLKLPDR